MHVIIDGCDGCGKSTLVDRLVQTYCLDKVSMTRYGWKELESYEQKSMLDNVISDRSFISEYVYSKVYDRPSVINNVAFNYLVLLYSVYSKEPWLFVILTANSDTLMSRVKKRGKDVEIKEEIEKKIEMYDKATKLVQDYGGICLRLDTSNMTENEVYDKVKEFIDEHCG